MRRIPRQTNDPVHSPLVSVSSNDAWTLWVTGPALELQQKLARIDGLQPTIIVRSEMACDTDTITNQTLDLIADAIFSRDVRCIVVCGQPGDAPLSSRLDQCLPQECARGYGHILQGTSARLEHQQRIQERVRTQLKQIRSHTGVALALTSHAISLCGMYYAPESDAFLVYDRTVDRFVPIAEAS